MRRETPLTYNLEDRTITLVGEPKPFQLPPKTDPALAYAAPLVEAINRTRGTPRGFAAESLDVLKLCRALIRADVSPADALAAVEYRGAEWIASPNMANRVCPASLLVLVQVRKTLDEIRAGPPVIRAGPATGSQRPVTGMAATSEILTARAARPFVDPFKPRGTP